MKLRWRVGSVATSLALSGGLGVVGPGAAAAPSAGVAINQLNGVAAVSRSDAWAVGYGYNGSKNKALVERWDGRRWRISASPNPGQGGSTLSGVAAVSGSSAWAVGLVTLRFVAGYAINGTLIEHWNGRRWRVQASPNPIGQDQLTGVAALSNSNVWAVGSSKLFEHTLIEHWNGRRWRVQPSPDPSDYLNVLTSVTAISRNDVWAVGYTLGRNTTYGTLIEHWNGKRWRVLPSSSPGTMYNAFAGVAAAGPSSVWAVGSSTASDGVQSALIEHWNGRRWTMQPSPNSAFGVALLSATSVSGTAVWAAGYTGSRTVAERWNGRKWKFQNTPDPIFSADPKLALNGLAALSPSNVWAVGYSGDVYNPNWRTLIEHWNGRRWSVVHSPNPL